MQGISDMSDTSRRVLGDLSPNKAGRIDVKTPLKSLSEFPGASASTGGRERGVEIESIDNIDYLPLAPKQYVSVPASTEKHITPKKRRLTLDRDQDSDKENFNKEGEAATLVSVFNNMAMGAPLRSNSSTPVRAGKSLAKPAAHTHATLAPPPV